MIKFFQNVSKIKDIYKIKELDVQEFIGKTYQNALARGYLRRINIENSNFELLIHSEEPHLYLFKNMQSKYKANKYDVLISFQELDNFHRAQNQVAIKRIDDLKILQTIAKGMNVPFRPTQSIFAVTSLQNKIINQWFSLDEKNQHWLKYLQSNKKGKLVSDFLSEDKRKIEETNRMRREAHIEATKNLYWHEIDLRSLLKNELQTLASDENINVTEPGDDDTKELTKPVLRDRLWKKLQERDEEKKEQFNKEQQEFNPDTETKEKLIKYASKNAIFLHIAPEKDDKYLRPGLEQYEMIETEEMIQYCNNQNISIGDIINKYKHITQPYNKIAKLKWDVFKQIIQYCHSKIKKFGYIPNGPAPNSIKYMKNYRKKAKSWYDIEFDKWHTPIARIQIICSCRSGEQLPSCCAHGSSALWLIYYSIWGELKKELEPTKKDEKIRNEGGIVNLNPYHEFSKERKKQNEKYHQICIKCKQNKGDEMTQFCYGCKAYYHPTCIGTTTEDIQKDRYVYRMWHCPFCSSNSVWTVRNVPTGIPPPDNAES